MDSASARNVCAAVRSSCDAVMRRATHVTIDEQAIAKAAAELSKHDNERFTSPIGFDTSIHLVSEPNLTLQYLLVVDALNFCFWPDEELEYEHLSTGVKEAVTKDPSILSADKLASIQGPQVQALLGWKRPLPQQEERARLLREVGTVLREQFGGEAANLVTAANKSAVTLVRLLTTHFPGFRDHCVHKGAQVFLYKRAQIFAGDVYGTFQGRGPGEFSDIDQLTMFADYRVPVVLRHLGVLLYSKGLSQQVDAKQELPPGSEEEVEIRAAAVVAVERLRAELQELTGVAVKSVLLDWCLWEMGEKDRHVQAPNHRTLTIYY